MATTETSSIHGQSPRTRGVLTPLASRGTVYQFVSGVSSDADAITAAIASLPATINVHGMTVPLAYATSRRTRADAAMVIGQYQYVLNGSSSADNPFAFANIYVKTEYEASWTYDLEGVETIYTEWDPQLKATVARQWQRPYTVMYIDVTVTLSSPIIGLLTAFHDTVNANAFTISNKTFSPMTLHMFGPRQRSVLTVGEAGQHQTTYQWRYRGEGGWFRYKLAGENTLAPPELIYPAVGWADFPTT